MNQRIGKICSYLQCVTEDKLRIADNVLRSKFGRNRNRHSKIGGRNIVPSVEGNKWLYNKILSGEPFAAVRYGGTEIATCKHCTAYYLGLQKELSQGVVDNLQRQSSFFPNNKTLLRFLVH